MTSAADMRRGAKEANEESARNAAAKRLGAAFGEIAFYVLETEKLLQRVAELEARVAKLDGVEQ